MRGSPKDKMPRGLRPIQRIELSEKNKKARIVLLIVFLVIALAAFAYAIVSFLNRDEIQPGWQSIEVQSEQAHCGNDLIFNYCIGQTETPATEEYHRLVALYSEAAVNAYRWFHSKEAFFEVNNVYTLSTNVGKELVVDEALYRAFALLQQKGSRYLYLAPLHQAYTDTFFGYHDAAIVENYDPYTNAETAAYFQQLAAFANDPTAVELELLGENRVRLQVSQEYLTFAEENGIEVFLDFYRLKNAFIVDYIADQLAAHGYTLGTVSSYDGYTRNLDTKNEYRYNLFDRVGSVASPVATVSYSGGGSLVYLRNYPLGEQDAYYFYISERLAVTPYIDVEDGLYKSAASGWISYSKSLSCAEVALNMLPIYLSSDLDESAVVALSSKGIASVWCREESVFYHDSSFVPSRIETENGPVYRVEFVE